MKKGFEVWIIIIFISLLFVVDALVDSKAKEEARNEAYMSGYEAGYNEAPDAATAYEEGFGEGAEAAASYIEEARWSPYGEDALLLLNDYFAGSSTREEAEEALEWISDYYWKTEGAIRDLRNGDANIG